MSTIPDPTYLTGVHSFSAVGDNLFAACGDRLLHSENGGAHWATILGGEDTSPLLITALGAAPDGTLICGVAGGLLRSPDSGATWETITLGDPPPVVSALVAGEGGLWLLSTLSDGVFLSEDNGQTWINWTIRLWDLRVLCAVLSPNFATSRTAFVGTETGLFRSTTGGRAWDEICLGDGHPLVMSLAASPQAVFAGTDAGLFRSVDGGTTWQALAPDTLGSVIDALAVGGQRVFIVQDGALLASADGGTSWAHLPDTKDLDALSLYYARPGLLLVGCMNGAVRALDVS